MERLALCDVLRRDRIEQHTGLIIEHDVWERFNSRMHDDFMSLMSPATQREIWTVIDRELRSAGARPTTPTIKTFNAKIHALTPYEVIKLVFEYIDEVEHKHHPFQVRRIELRDQIDHHAQNMSRMNAEYLTEHIGNGLISKGIRSRDPRTSLYHLDINEYIIWKMMN